MDFERTSEIPNNTDEWSYREMYKDNMNGAKMIWKIGFNNPNIIVHHGHKDGAIQKEVVEVELNNSGRNIYEQSVIQINNRYLKKHREGYRCENEPSAIKGPMLAHKFQPGKTEIHYPIGCTAKLDGIRCLIRRDGDKIIYRSRNNKEYKHLDIFNDSMNSFFDFLPPGVELDGEMYSDELTFNSISSVFRKEINTNVKDIKKYIKYHIFDCNIDKPYEDRWKMIVTSYKLMCKNFQDDNYIVIMNTFWAKTEDELYSFHRHVRSKGFEGTMIRKLYISDQTDKGYKSSMYISGRKNNILKLKDIEDEEGTILKIVEGKGREKGIALMVVKDPRGNIFNVRPAATFEQRKLWFENPDTIIGKKMTYEYQNLSETGVPRFPVGKDIRDYE